MYQFRWCAHVNRAARWLHVVNVPTWIVREPGYRRRSGFNREKLSSNLHIQLQRAHVKLQRERSFSFPDDLNAYEYSKEGTSRCKDFTRNWSVSMKKLDKVRFIVSKRTRERDLDTVGGVCVRFVTGDSTSDERKGSDRYVNMRSF